MFKVCVGITTFKKPKALRNMLENLPNIGKVSHISIADDNEFETKEICEEFQSKYESGNYIAPLALSSGPNKGIAINKNRNIKFFLEETQDDYLILLDDDLTITTNSLAIKFPTAGFGRVNLLDQLIDAQLHSGMEHLTGFLAGIPDPLTKAPFLSIRPMTAEDKYLYYYSLSQGILLFFTRNIVEKTGYFDWAIWKSKYGYEHSAYSARCLRVQGYQPETFPILKHCHRWLKCAGIPNNYSADPGPNAEPYKKRINEVYLGVGLKKDNPGI